MTFAPLASPIAFIGAGNIGAPMAERLLERGRKLLVCDVSETTRERFAALGCEVTDSPGDCAGCGTIIFMVTVILWLLLSFPKAAPGESQVDASIAGKLANGLAVVVEPIGFNRDMALALIPAMAATGGSGFSLARSRRGRLVEAKQRRMKMVAVNGLLVLLPSALLLARWASAGRLDAGFYALQGLELVAGATNITLLALNLRDGRRLAGRR